MTVAVTVLYPGDCKFDKDYYLKTHMPLVGKHFGPHGLKTWRITELQSLDLSAKRPFSIQADLIFDSVEQVKKAFQAEASVILGDIPNFTDASATILVGEEIGTGKGESK